MAFDLSITNIGKLTDAQLSIGQFTVFAGPNNTGKSYVSKLLYSLFDAMNANHALVHLSNMVSPVQGDLDSLKNSLELADRDYEDLPLSVLYREISAMVDLMKSCPTDNVQEIQQLLPILTQATKNMKEAYQVLEPNIRKLEMPKAGLVQWAWLENSLTGLGSHLNDLYEKVSKADAKEFVLSGITYKIRQNLTQNFQIANLSDLRREPESGSSLEIDELGIFVTFDDSNAISFDIDPAGLRKLQEYSRVLYLESPVYWKLKAALERAQRFPRFFHMLERERLSGVPGYFYDLASALLEEYTGDMAFPDLYQELTGETKLAGKIIISENGELSFRENGRHFSLPVTAMGVINLGILALLIERKILDKGAFLFVDEPEAHLHPSWQIVMAESLFALAKGGVKVVIATHSADILKWLEVHVKRNPDDKSLVALNQFPVAGSASNEQDFEDRMATIKQELTRPFSDLYLEGLL